ncbi:MAG: RICIN domain-containing protein [Actinoallomurus sp.]
MSFKPKSDGTAEPLRVRRPVELPEANTDAATGLKPASGTRPTGPAPDSRCHRRDRTRRTAGGSRAGKRTGRPGGARERRADTTVFLENAGSGLCADVPGNGGGSIDGPVDQYRCSLADNQVWALDVLKGSTGPGGASLFVIRNTTGDLCMDLPYGDARARHEGDRVTTAG